MLEAASWRRIILKNFSILKFFSRFIFLLIYLLHPLGLKTMYPEKSAILR